MNNDLISISEAKKLGASCLARRNENGQLEAIISLDNAPTVEARIDPNDIYYLCDRLIGNKQRGTLRRAILEEVQANNMTLIPTAVLDDLTKTTRELGEWKIDGALIACDVCGQILLKASKLYKYCPNCGALMVNNGGD